MMHPLLDSLYTKLFLRDRVFFFLITGAFFAYLLLWIFLILVFDTFRASDTDYITLHYRMTLGTDFIARWESIFLLPATATCIILCNIIVGRSLIHIHKPSAHACAALALFATAGLFLALTFLYTVNL